MLINCLIKRCYIVVFLDEFVSIGLLKAFV